MMTCKESYWAKRREQEREGWAKFHEYLRIANLEAAAKPYQEGWQPEKRPTAFEVVKDKIGTCFTVVFAIFLLGLPFWLFLIAVAIL